VHERKLYPQKFSLIECDTIALCRESLRGGRKMSANNSWVGYDLVRIAKLGR
jgi:hypothetical protein